MEALGFVEVVGFVPAVEATDTMRKAANVQIVARPVIGGGLVTIVVSGDVGAVKTAVDAGSEASKKVGELYASLFLARAHEAVLPFIQGTMHSFAEKGKTESLGLVEVKGLVAAIAAADAALKAANVRLVGRTNVGMGLISVILEGEIGAVKSAVDSAAEAARKVGEVVSAHVIARPDESSHEMVRQPTI